MTQQPELPAGYTDAATPPAPNTPVLGIRRASCHGSYYEVLTVRYEPCRPLAPWRTSGNDAVTDSGDGGSFIATLNHYNYARI